MKKDDLIDSLGRIDDALIESVDTLRRNRRNPGWKKWAGLAASFCLLLGLVAAMPEVLPEKPPVQNDFPNQTDPTPPVETNQVEPLPVWTAYYNDRAVVASDKRANVKATFVEELEDAQMAALEPARWYDGMDRSAYAVFDQDGRLLEVCLDVTLAKNTVHVQMTDFAFGDCVVIPGDVVPSVCGDVEYRLYQYVVGTKFGDKLYLSAEAVIGGLYFDFYMETAREELDQARLDFQAVLECFASYPEGKPDLSGIVPKQVPELMEKTFASLSDARREPDFGRYLPRELPRGFSESEIYRFRFDETDRLSALWSRGLDDLTWVITPFTEDDENRLTGVEELENYDLSLYPIPRADSVPEELWEIVDDPIFDAGELTLDAVYRRAYKVRDAGDTDGWRMRFCVRYGDVVVSINSKGVEPEWLYQQLAALPCD